MLSLIKIEFEKLWKRPKFLVFILIIFCINLFSFAYFQNQDVNIPLNAYHEFEQTLEHLPNNERYSFVKDYTEQINAFTILKQLDNLRNDPVGNQYLIEQLKESYPNIEENYRHAYNAKKTKYYTKNLESESKFINQIKKQMDVLHEYPTYLTSIEDNAKTISSISIFQNEDSYTNENIIKSAKDYQNCKDIEIIYENEKGILDALQFPLTYLLILISMFVIVFYMITEEKDKGLFTVIKTTPKKHIIFIKILVMMISIGIVVVLLNISQLIYMEFTCGLGTLSRSIQSLASYQQCPLKINVLQFLGITLFFKWIGASCLGLLMLVIAIKSNHKGITIFTITSIVFIEYVLFVIIDPLGKFVLCKYLNFIFLLQAERIFQMYLNINIFNHAVSLYTLLLLFILGCYFFLVACAYITFYQRKTSYKTQLLPCRKKQTGCLSSSLWKQELYKIVWMQKGILLFIAVLFVNGYQWSNTNIYRTPEQLAFMEYMEVLEGPLNKEKEEFLKTETYKISELEKQLEKTRQREENGEISRQKSQEIQDMIQSQLSQQEDFQKILTQYEAMKHDSKLSFVNPFAYEDILLYTPWTILPAIITLLIMFITIGNIDTFEYRFGMDKLIATTPLGNKKVRQYKRRITYIFSFFFFLVMNIFLFIKMKQTYGFTSLTASIKSIESFKDFPIHMPIILFMLLHLCIQYYAFLCSAILCQTMSRKFNSYITGVFLSFVIFVVPLILTYGGYHFLNFISLYPLLMNGIYLQTTQGVFHLLCSIAGYGSIVFFLVYDKKKNIIK